MFIVRLNEFKVYLYTIYHSTEIDIEEEINKKKSFCCLHCSPFIPWHKRATNHLTFGTLWSKYKKEILLASTAETLIIHEMENLKNKTKQISTFIFDSGNSRLIKLRGHNTWVKAGLDFRRLSCTSWDEVEMANEITKVSLPKGTFKVDLYPCESQPSSCRASWQVSSCVKVPGKSRKCKVVHHSGSRENHAFSANISYVEDKAIIWGTIKDEKHEGEDFELVLSAPAERFETFKNHNVMLTGTLKRGIRKKDTPFVLTHDALVLSQA